MNTINTSSAKPSTPRPLIILLSGPSGVGKDTVISKIREQDSSIFVTVNVTTRSIRSCEIDGLDYIFTNKNEFDRMIKANMFLEHANVYGNHYGVPKDQVISALSRGQDALIKADVQGAKTIMQIEPNVLSIFLMPESTLALERRLTLRMTESKQALKTRLKTAISEINQANNFEYIVYNKDGCITETVREIKRIINNEKTRIPPRIVKILNPE